MVVYSPPISVRAWVIVGKTTVRGQVSTMPNCQVSSQQDMLYTDAFQAALFSSTKQLCSQSTKCGLGRHRLLNALPAALAEDVGASSSIFSHVPDDGKSLILLNRGEVALLAEWSVQAPHWGFEHQHMRSSAAELS